MIIIGDNLSELMAQHAIVDRGSCFDETCINLHLGNSYIQLCPTENVSRLIYGEKIPDECFQKKPVPCEGLLIPPKTSFLACSAEMVNMPLGYMGLLQTKGSLARLFVSLHFADGQIDPGFRGHVTFEIFNGSEFDIVIRRLQPVGNLYIFKASTKQVNPYSGRYAGTDSPTIQYPFK